MLNQKDYIFLAFMLSKFWKVEETTLKSRWEKLKPIIFSYCPELPKRPKQKNSCSKMCLLDQLYIKLGYIPLDRSWWPEICQHPNSSDLRNCCCRKTGQATITTKAWNCDDDGKSSEHPPLCGYWPLAFTLEPKHLWNRHFTIKD